MTKRAWYLLAILAVLVIIAPFAARAEEKEWYQPEGEWKVENRVIELRSGNQVTVGAGAGAIVWPQPELDVLETKVSTGEWDAIRRARFERAANDLLGKIEFRFDIDELVATEDEDKAPLATLEELVVLVQVNQDFGLKLAGHTDAMGTDEYNMDLSFRRAEFIRRALIAKGVDGARLQASFHGEKELLVKTEGKERKNRRVQASVFDMLAPR